MSDDGSVTAVVRPDLEECARVLTPVMMRQRGMVIYRVTCAVLGIVFLFFAVYVITQPPSDLFLAFFLAILGLMLLLLPPIAVARMVRGRVQAQLKATTDHGSITLSGVGIDTKNQHSSAHFDWAAVNTIRRIPEGMLIQLGRTTTTMFVAARYFETQSDFERAVAIAREAASAKFA